MGVAAATALATTTWAAVVATHAEGSEQTGRLTERPLVRLDDAVDAVAGRDYDVIDTLRGAEAVQAVALAPDGAVLLDRSDTDGRLTLLDPHTGDRTRVVTAPAPATVDAVTADTVVTSSVIGGRLRVVWFDRASGSSSERTVPRVSALPGAHPLPDVGVTDDRTVWFVTYAPNGESGQATKTQLWQAPAAGEPRLVARVTDFAVAADAVAWTQPPDRASATVHVRNLAGGATSSFTLPDCTAGSKTAALESVLGSGELLALDTVCPHGPATRTFLVRADGEVLADVAIGDEPFPTSVGDAALTLTPSFVYDVRNRRLLRLNHPRYEHSPWPLAVGDLIAWHTGAGVDGGPLRIARLR